MVEGRAGGRRAPCRQTAITYHNRLLLPFQVHCLVTEPEATWPPPSRTSPVVRFAMVYWPFPRSVICHCWLVPPFHGACCAGWPLAAPQLSATMPLVRLTSR